MVWGGIYYDNFKTTSTSTGNFAITWPIGFRAGKTYTRLGAVCEIYIIATVGGSQVGFYQATATFNMPAGTLAPDVLTLKSRYGSLIALAPTLAISTTYGQIIVTPPSASTMYWLTDVTTRTIDGSIS